LGELGVDLRTDDLKCSLYSRAESKLLIARGNLFMYRPDHPFKNATSLSDPRPRVAAFPGLARSLDLKLQGFDHGLHLPERLAMCEFLADLVRVYAV
jgi:hypothetical protein